MIRALFRSAKVTGAPAPYDTLTLKVFYPAVFGNTPQERNTGLIPADASGAPYPVMVFFSGVNVGMESYAWLAVELARRGVIAVLFNWVAEDFPGSVSLTPGMDLERLRPHTYGSGPSASALPAILECLADLNAHGVLAGLLDLQRVVLGGHSAGGTMALLNANRAWFPQVKGAFAYGAHAGASTLLGFPPAAILALPDSPLLIVGGARDGVVEASAHRYALDAAATPTLLLERTFHEGAQRNAALVILEGANHFLVCHPRDETTGRGFLEPPATGDEAALRLLFASMVHDFIKTVTSQNGRLREIVSPHPLVNRFEIK